MFKCVIFKLFFVPPPSKSLGKYLLRGGGGGGVGGGGRLGMPTVPYWLPAVTQEERKMEESARAGTRAIKGRSGDDVRTRAPEASSLPPASHLSPR